jgi:hypothetical protein
VSGGLTWAGSGGMKRGMWYTQGRTRLVASGLGVAYGARDLDLPRRRDWTCRLDARRAIERGDGMVLVWTETRPPGAGLARHRPGYRCRLICRLHRYRGSKGETKALPVRRYRDLVIAAHRQQPGGNIVLIWDNLTVHLRAKLWPVWGSGRGAAGGSGRRDPTTSLSIWLLMTSVAPMAASGKRKVLR